MATSILPAQYQRVFESLPGAFLLLLPDAHFTIAGVSEQYLIATLQQREELIGRPVFDVFPDNPATPDASSTRNLSLSLHRVLATREPDAMTIQRYDVPRPDGSGFDVRFWSPINAPVLLDDGELLCIVHRVDNVTEYVELTEENRQQRKVTAHLNADKLSMEAEIVARSRDLDRANHKLRLANSELSAYAERARSAAQDTDEFLAMLAHELRNPLAAMTSALQLWNMGTPDQERQRRLIAVCTRQVHNLTRLVDDLLEMSRIHHGAVELQRKPLDMHDVLETAIHAVRDTFEARQLSLSMDIAPGGFAVFGDPTSLEQVLTNLLGNAAKYSEPGGQVEIILGPSQARPGWVQIVVADHGRGIPANKLTVIFEAFAQVDPGIDRARGGLGIGLALVQSIVTLHGGVVHARSEGMGRGSSFVVELPLLSDVDLVDPAPLHAAQDGAQLPQASPQTARVLVVEDNADAREMLSALLATSGYIVSTASDGREGLRKLVELEPDIAIIDIGLPEMDGLELARRARAQIGHKTKMVALTGYTSAKMRSEALDAGFDEHVAKPCTAEKLSTILAA